MTEYAALLDRNAKALESLSGYIPRRKFVDIVASAKFPSMELALAARKFAISRIEERDGNAAKAVCTIKLTPDKNGFHKSQVAVFAVPTAKIVTDAEMVIREACEQFGGVGPGWDILLPSSEWLKKQVLGKSDGQNGGNDPLTDEEMLKENAAALESLSGHFSEQRRAIVQISAIFLSREVVQVARSEIEGLVEASKSGDLANAAVTTSKLNDGSGRYACEIRLRIVPEARPITEAESIVRSVAEKHGGEQTGWDILPESAERTKDVDGSQLQ